MSNDKNKMADKAGEIAKNIWLAGVGAYGRAVDEAQGRLEKAGVEPPKLFRELVKAGAALEEEARDALQAGQSARQSVEERIHRVRENFNMQRVANNGDLQELNAKIDKLARKVDKLTHALEESGTLQPPKRKATAKRKPPARSKSTSAPAARKKAATKKAAARAASKTRR